MSLHVLALDPGQKVGWARTEVAEDGSWGRLVHGITPLQDMALALCRPDAQGRTAFEKYDVVIMESWRLSAAKARSFIGSDFPTVQFIGMMRLLRWLHPKTKLVMQDPATKKSALASMRRLKPELFEQVTAPVAHDDGHDDDAIMHLWHWTWTELITQLPIEGTSEDL